MEITGNRRHKTHTNAMAATKRLRATPCFRIKGMPKTSKAQEMPSHTKFRASSKLIQNRTIAAGFQ
jgi:hypothetical protein